MTKPLRPVCVDSSVAVAAFGSWHERHADALAVLAAGAQISGHALTETYSVLTRLPQPYRVAGPVAADYLNRRFTRSPLTVTGRQLIRALATFAGRGITGGATYDALIALIAITHEHRLVTLDERASRTYRALDCPFELL